MNPIVSIDGVSATGLDAAAGKNASAATTVSPSFDVAVRLRRRWFRLLPDTYTNGTVSVSFAGAGGAAGRSQVHEPYSPLSHGFRAMCAATALGGGNSTAAASCTVVRIPSPNDLSWFQ
uniref:Uncharacterized protein n=1 Tax=Oryza barthii TaxID=65489 RepID=A0A0D3HEY1_9ORYZ